MYALLLRNASDAVTFDFCLLGGNGSGPETHIRVTKVHLNGPADSDGQVLLGNTTSETSVSDCDGKSCDSIRVIDRVMILSEDLASSVTTLIQVWREAQRENSRRWVQSGPSREQLFDSLRLSDEDRKVIFLLRPNVSDLENWCGLNTNMPIEMSVHVLSIKSLSKSGCDWSIALYDSQNLFGMAYLVGTYNSTSRRGWFTPTNSI